MSETASPVSSRPRWQPLLLIGVLLIVVRSAGLILHFFSRDPDGNVIAASPLASLMIALPYHGVAVLGLVAGFWLAWKVAWPIRPLITLLGITVFWVEIVAGQIDLGLQWFIGQRFSPMILETYVGRHVLSNDLYEPVLFHPWYFGAAMLLMFGPLVVVAWNFFGRRRIAGLREPSWLAIALVAGGAMLCRIPVHLAYGHQRDVLRPPELLFVNHWLYPSPTPPVVDEARAFANLRAMAESAPSSWWGQ